MNNNKLLAIIGLIFLNIVAGYLALSAAFGGASRYDNAVQRAESYCEQKLYQKSIEAYNKALEIKRTPELIVEKLKVYDEGIAYGELEDSYDLQTELDSIVQEYYKEPAIYEAVCNLCLKYEDYEACVTYLKQAKSQKVKNDVLDEITEKIRYLYQNQYTMYENVTNETNGDYLIETNGMISIIDANDESVVPGKYLWATHFSQPVGSGDNAVKFAVVSKNDNNQKRINYIVDNAGRKQIYIDAQIDGAYSMELLNEKYIFPCRIGEQYYFYSFEPETEKVEKLNGPYLFAGAYRNGLAAVKVAENKWQLLDANGKQVGSDFSDIVLNDAAECTPKGLLIAATNGKYQIYKLNDQGIPEVVAGFACDGAKAFVDGSYAAFKSGEKWGFVDPNGKIMIQAKYENARSFSQGFAAICVSGMWKYINTSDQVVIDAEDDNADDSVNASGFTNAGDFSASGKCFVEDGGYWTGLQLYYVEDEK